MIDTLLDFLKAAFLLSLLASPVIALWLKDRREYREQMEKRLMD